MISRRSFKSIDSVHNSSTDNVAGSAANRALNANIPGINASLSSPASSNTGSDRKIARSSGMWRWFAILLFLGMALYFFTHEGELESTQRTVRGGHPEKRELTIVLNTFKRYDLMTSKYCYIIMVEMFAIIIANHNYRGDQLLFPMRLCQVYLYNLE